MRRQHLRHGAPVRRWWRGRRGRAGHRTIKAHAVAAVGGRLVASDLTLGNRSGVRAVKALLAPLPMQGMCSPTRPMTVIPCAGF